MAHCHIVPGYTQTPSKAHWEAHWDKDSLKAASDQHVMASWAPTDNLKVTASSSSS